MVFGTAQKKAGAAVADPALDQAMRWGMSSITPNASSGSGLAPAGDTHQANQT